MATQIALNTYVLLDLMLQQPSLPGDDDGWNGSTSNARRRKLQNRTNQRAHREFLTCFVCANNTELTRGLGKRKREERKLCSSISPESDSASTNDSGIITKPGCLTQRKRANLDSNALLAELWRLFYSAVGPQRIDHSNLERVGRICVAKGIESEGIITAFQQWANHQNIASSPRIDCVLVLVKFNLFRAFISNGKKLGFSTAEQYLGHDELSPFVKPVHPEDTLLSLHSLPLALRPTKSQCQTPHHPWLDLLPDPVMRDNLIRESGGYDEGELCDDLIGLFSASAERNGLIVWGEPWDPSGWEVTKPFLKHWGWVLRGCDELLQATNYWREKRGEPPLNF